MVENQRFAPKLYVVKRHHRPKSARFSSKLVESEVCPPIFVACGAPWVPRRLKKGVNQGVLSDNTLNSRVITRSGKHPHFTRDVTRESCLAQVKGTA